MNLTRLSLLLTLCSLPAAGCMTARVAPYAELKGSWAEDPARDRKVREDLEEHADELTAEIDPAAVDVWVGKIPAGLTLRDQVLSVETGAPYEIIGRARINFNNGTALWFSDYEDGWRKPYCYWQVPLTWTTLGIWMVVPVNYPCGVEAWRTKEDVLNATRNLVKRAGGDLFVGDYVAEREDYAMGMDGFVIRKLQPEAPAPAAAVSSEM
jgi:hypothetical protein